MNRSYTVSLLQTLDKSELTALGKFLKSPFFTAKKFLFPLFQELRQRGVEADAEAETKAAFARVFPGEDYTSRKWQRALSDLNHCIEDFLAVQQLLRAPDLRLQAEVEAFFIRDDKKLFQKVVRAARRLLAGPKIRETVESWRLRFWLIKRELVYPYTDRTHIVSQSLDTLEETLDHYYYISKLQLACNRAARTPYERLRYDQAEYEALLTQTRALNQLGKSPLLRLLRALLELLTAQDARFVPFFDLLKKEGMRLERSELEAVVRLTQSFCIRRDREGDPNAFAWYREAYDWASRKKVWTESAAEEVFLNTGIMFARSHDIKGFRHFITNYKKTLLSDLREDIVALLWANWHFHQAEFDQTALLLNTRVSTRRPRIALLFHSLNIRNHYEELLERRIEPADLERALVRFEEFIARKESFAEPLRQSHKDQVWFVRQMAQNGKKASASKARLQEALAQKKPATRGWIVAKVNGLPV